MLQERDQQVCAEEEDSGEPPARKTVYALMRCPGSCELGPHCWQDPYGKKHYKLYRDQLESLVKYMQTVEIRSWKGSNDEGKVEEGEKYKQSKLVILV
jgi:hypothetical protein